MLKPTITTNSKLTLDQLCNADFAAKPHVKDARIRARISFDQNAPLGLKPNAVITLGKTSTQPQWTGTIAQLFDFEPDKFGQTLETLEWTERIPKADEEQAEETRTLEDICHLLSLNDLKDVADNPHVTVISS